MLCTEDFTMRHYVGFSQIGSHISIHNINTVFYLNRTHLYTIKLSSHDEQHGVFRFSNRIKNEAIVVFSLL